MLSVLVDNDTDEYFPVFVVKVSMIGSINMSVRVGAYKLAVNELVLTIGRVSINGGNDVRIKTVC